ncbi:MAG: eutA [Clostridia bacterium]|jgi:ethanolamine utilization protein EutA|nr:eutA [Clostridia bacterium]
MASFLSGGGGRAMDKIYTLGMDIGTTTTQLIISEIEVENLTANYLSVEPKILSRKMIYQSPIVITPMYDSYHLNETELIKMFFEFINASGVDIKKIKTGAVIITGESSLKENASALIHSIADSTGEFIVAAAGADLEAILAGCGSGAKDVSYRQNEVLTNIDIGGGTTNIVKFDRGEVSDTFTLHIGGRLLKIDNDFKVTYLSPVLQKILALEGVKVKEGSSIAYREMRKAAELMAGYIAKALTGELESKYDMLYVSGQKALAEATGYFVSGGVGEYVYDEFEESSIMKACLKYQDLGPLLGTMVRKVFKKRGFNLSKPKHRMRATVCGSGSYSMQLSGNTIYVDENILPLKNLPLIRMTYENNTEECVKAARKLIGYHRTQTAIYITYKGNNSYEDIIMLAKGIIQITEELLSNIIIILDKNVGKALGQTVKRYLKETKPIICIDHIQNTHGNYIDLGKMVGGSLPIVIKSLIF